MPGAYTGPAPIPSRSFASGRGSPTFDPDMAAFLRMAGGGMGQSPNLSTPLGYQRGGGPAGPPTGAGGMGGGSGSGGMGSFTTSPLTPFAGGSERGKPKYGNKRASYSTAGGMGGGMEDMNLFWGR